MAVLKKDAMLKFKEHYIAEDKEKITEYYFQDKWPKRLEFTKKEFSEIVYDAELLQKGYPLAQITGVAYFYGYQFDVDEHVLIPRPETEELVEWILEYNLKHKKILDIGTGSGCIPIILRLKSEATQITGWEVSRPALTIAQQNAKKLEADVDFELVDILNLRKEHARTEWDLIVSNPPYVQLKESSPSITYEPEIALFAPEQDPILYYREIGEWAIKALKPGGLLFFELSEFTYKQVKDLMWEIGFKEVALRKDLQGKMRMLSALKAN